MSKSLPLRVVSLICLVIITGVAGTGSMTVASPYASPRSDGAERSTHQMVLVSQEIHALQVDGLVPGGTYLVNAEYRFRNPGDERTVRFNIPLSPEKAKTSVVVQQDGEPVSFETGPDGNVCWSGTMAEGEEKHISLAYIIHSEKALIDGTLEQSDGKTKTVTNTQDIFFSIHEHLNIPVLDQDDSLVWETGPKVRIDLDPAVPAFLVTASPSGYSIDAGSVGWALPVEDHCSEFSAGFLRIGDCLYDLTDAEWLVSALTDRTYSGYISDLTRRERGRYLSIARNGIFAKHGYVFESGMDEYFSRLSWYEPDDDYTDSRLSDLDREMVNLITAAERFFK